jgi:ABC-type glycerol-3-phosphate transport system substrate-binding protein
MICGCGASPAQNAATEPATGAAAPQTTAPAATEAATTAATTAAPATEPAAEFRQITAILQIGSDIKLDGNPVVKIIEDATKVKLDIEAPPSDGYGDRVKILASTDDLPDLIHYGADVFAQQWSDEGLLLDVTDLIAKYPNLSSNITKEQYGDCIFLPDGRIYGIPKPNSYDSWGYIINKKWLNNLNLEPPKTIEDYINVSRAFTNGDPNGDGAGGTYGGGLHQSPWHLQNDFVSMAYSISGWHHGMPDVDGSAKLRALKSRYGDYLKLLRSMYEEGIIDREFITHTGEENQEKFAQQRVGFVGASQKGFTGILEKFELNMDDYMYCPPLVLNASETPRYAMPPSNWMAYYVNAKAKDPDAVLTVLDYGNSGEGFVLMQLGVEGTNYDSYDIEKRTVTRSSEQATDVKMVTGNMFAFANAFKGLPPTQGGTKPESIAKWQSEAPAADAATEKVYFGFTKMIDKVGIQFPDEAEALKVLEVRFIVGEAAYEELQNFVDNEYAPKVAPIQKELEDYMAANPPRYVK